MTKTLITFLNCLQFYCLLTVAFLPALCRAREPLPALPRRRRQMSPGAAPAPLPAPHIHPRHGACGHRWALGDTGCRTRAERWCRGSRCHCLGVLSPCSPGGRHPALVRGHKPTQGLLEGRSCKTTQRQRVAPWPFPYICLLHFVKLITDRGPGQHFRGKPPSHLPWEQSCWVNSCL